MGDREEQLEKRVEQLEQKLKELQQKVGEDEPTEEDEEDSGISRRGFLKKLGLGAAGIGAASMLPSASALEIQDSNGLQVYSGGTHYLDADGDPINVKNADLSMDDGDIMDVHDVTFNNSESANSNRSLVWDDSVGLMVRNASGNHRVVAYADTLSGGTDISISGGTGSEAGSISIDHNDTSSQGNVSTGGATVIDDIDLDGRGHVTNINTENRSLNEWNAANNTSFDSNGNLNFASSGDIHSVSNINVSSMSSNNGSDPIDVTQSMDIAESNGSYALGLSGSLNMGSNSIYNATGFTTKGGSSSMAIEREITDSSNTFVDLWSDSGTVEHKMRYRPGGSLDFTDGSSNNTIRMYQDNSVALPNGNLNMVDNRIEKTNRLTVRDDGSNNGALYFKDGGNWTGNAGSSEGKIEHHGGKFYINSGDSSDHIVTFRNSGGNNQVAIWDNGTVHAGSNAFRLSGNGNYIHDINGASNIRMRTQTGSSRFRLIPRDTSGGGYQWGQSMEYQWDNQQWRIRTDLLVNGDLTVSGSSPGADIQIFNSDGTWNKPSGAEIVHVEVISAGGGGQSSWDTNDPGTGGGGGGRVNELFRASDLPDSVSVTVGAGGSGGSGNYLVPGDNGGDSKFGDFIIVKGGKGGGTDSGSNGGHGGGPKGVHTNSNYQGVGLLPGQGGNTTDGDSADWGGAGGAARAGYDGGNSVKGGGGGGSGGGSGETIGKGGAHGERGTGGGPSNRGEDGGFMEGGAGGYSNQAGNGEGGNGGIGGGGGGGGQEDTGNDPGGDGGDGLVIVRSW